MPIINFTIPPALLKKIEEEVRKQGFSSKAEFFRHCAHLYFGSMQIDLLEEEEDEPSDELIEAMRVAQEEYASGKLKAYSSMDELIEDLHDDE